MKVFVVLAHPDPQSFNAAMKETAVETFSQAGHEVRVTDLHADHFKAISDSSEFDDVMQPGEGLAPDVMQQRQAEAETIPADVREQLDNIEWCDLLVLQFPIWWFSAPAILKGWFERVLVKGVAYGGGRKHGKGVFKGRHGLISCTTGTPAETYAPDGIEGDIERLLWPINNGIFHYLGMTPYKPFVSFAPRSQDDEVRAKELEKYSSYLQNLGPASELPMHDQEDYGDDERLLPDITPKSGFQYRK